MAKAIGIDYGKKRIGIAISDSLQIISSALTTIDTSNIFTFLKELLEKEEIDYIVVGEPRNLNNTATDSTEMTEKFVEQLSKNMLKFLLKELMNVLLQK